MLVLSMESKRQRRPNVRLGEIGDVSAAVSCGVSQKIKNNIGEKIWEDDFINAQESEYNHISRFSRQISSEFMFSYPGVSPRISADMQQNTENKNPNNMKFVSEFASLDEIEMRKSKLNFDSIAQKSRLTKKRKRSTRCKRTDFGGAWNFEVCAKIIIEDGKENGGKEVIGCASNPCLNFYDAHSPDHETSAMSKEACENYIVEPTFNVQTGGNSIEIWKDGASLEGNNAFSESFGRYEKMEVCHSDVNSVGIWLEELGFGKYAGVFEMHEVDEEALPLLTFEDLKEMGVLDIGPRRKLYTAIRQLRDSGGWVQD